MTKELPVLVRCKCENCGAYKPLGRDDRFGPGALVCFDCHMSKGEPGRKSYKKLPAVLKFASR